MCEFGRVCHIIHWLSDVFFFFFQAEDGIRDLVRSRGLGDVYKRQQLITLGSLGVRLPVDEMTFTPMNVHAVMRAQENLKACLLYTSDAADERSSVDLGGRRIIKKKNSVRH